MTLFVASASVGQRVPLPPIPVHGEADPYVATSEVILLLVAAVLTVLVGVTLVVFLARQQRKGTSDV